MYDNMFLQSSLSPAHLVFSLVAIVSTGGCSSVKIVGMIFLKHNPLTIT